MHKRWNISILVIFVLLASSLLGVLSMNFVQQMMKQSAVVNSYYKAYYLSKAWIELWLAAIKYRGVWFEYTVNTGSAIVRDNFFSGFTYSLSTTISGTAPLLSKKFWLGSGCENYPYTLTGGESIILPLFRDKTPWTMASVFTTGMVLENLANLFKNNQIKITTEFDWDATFGILILSGEELSQNGMFFHTWTLKWLPAFKDQFEAYLRTIDPTQYPLESQLKSDYEKPWLIDKGFKMFLLVSNSSPTPQSFCVKIDPPDTVVSWQLDVLPTDAFFIQSQASFGDQRVALDASYVQPIPGFLFTTYSSNQ